MTEAQPQVKFSKISDFDKGLPEQELNKIVPPIEYDEYFFEWDLGMIVNRVLDAVFLSQHRTIEGLMVDDTIDLTLGSKHNARDVAEYHRDDFYKLVGKYFVDYVACSDDFTEDHLEDDINQYRSLFSAAALGEKGVYAHCKNPPIWSFLMCNISNLVHDRIKTLKRYKPLFEKYIGMDEYVEIRSRLGKIYKLIETPVKSKRLSLAGKQEE